jgi:hypothetical protein
MAIKRWVLHGLWIYGRQFKGEEKRATERSRTADLIITSELLYQLSYGG